MIDYDVAWEYYNPESGWEAGRRLRDKGHLQGNRKGLDNGLFWDNGKGLRPV